MQISEGGRLIHENWYDENQEYDSSDEEDAGHEFDSNLNLLSELEGEDGEAIGLYDSEYATD
jgi:hypothetical protein